MSNNPTAINEEKTGLSDTRSSEDQTRLIAERAIEKIEDLTLKATPQVYELWFRYYQGDPEIVRAIDTHTGVIDEISCHKLYKRFLSESSRDDAMKRISDQMQQAVSNMVTMLSSVQSATNEYGSTLGDLGEQIEGAESIEDLGQIVSVIVEDTKKMMLKNQELELQLVNSSEQVTELRKNLDNVRKEAMTDGLTGLHNRKAFDKKIRDCLEDAATVGTPVTLLMLDIDHFKNFNDTFGHQVGDQVLRLVARTLTDGVKGRDMAARYGGEEFAIILPETPLEAGTRVAETLRQTIESKEVVNKTNQENLGQITLSIGVATYTPGENATEFIHRTDGALYQAKKFGRNRVVTTDDMPEEATR